MESPYLPIKFKNLHPEKEEQEAVQPFLDFLEYFRKGDLQSMRKHTLPSGLRTDIGPTGIDQVTLTDLIEPLKKQTTDQIVAKPLYDVEVWVDGKIAVAWTPYYFFVTRDGETKMSHRGTDVVFLAKLDGKWKISGITSNYRLAEEDGKGPAKRESLEEQGPANEKAVLDIYQQFIDSICSHEYESLHSLLLPGMLFASHRGNEVGFMGADAVIKLCHQLYDGKVVSVELLSVTVRVDHDVAMIWCQFRTVAGGHETVGSDMFAFVKIDDKWKIAGLGDNYE